MKIIRFTHIPVAIALACVVSSMLFAEQEVREEVKKEEEAKVMEVVVSNKFVDGGVETVKLEYVTYNLDRSQFVGYYQDGWFEMVSLHDAKTKKQIGYVYCKGGVPKTFRFSKDGKHLGAEASVGWYVWKIPSFEEVLILSERLDFYEFRKKQTEAKKLVTPEPEER